MNNVSVIIAAYNAEKTIARAIQSALCEPEVVEVIVVDDNSTDKTAQKAYEIHNPKLKIISLGVNSGPSVARNLGIAESTGEWIAILDSDDYFLPGRFKTMLQYDADIIADNLLRIPDGSTEGTKFLNIKQPKTINFKEFVLSNVTRKKGAWKELGFLKPIIRRSFIEKSNVRYRTQMRLDEDYDFYARLLAK